MKITETIVIIGALVIALIISILSLFYTSVDDSIPEQNQIHHLVTGTNVVCDNREGRSPDSCMGEYYRGWPIDYGEGTVLKSTDNNWVETFNVNWDGFFVNYFFWVLPSLTLAAVIVVVMEKD